MKETDERNDSLIDYELLADDGFIQNDRDRIYKEGMRFTRDKGAEVTAMIATFTPLCQKNGEKHISDLSVKINNISDEGLKHKVRKSRIDDVPYGVPYDHAFIDPPFPEGVKDPLNGRKLNNELKDAFIDFDNALNEEIEALEEGSYARRALTACKKEISYAVRKDRNSFLKTDIHYNEFKTRLNDFPMPKFAKKNKDGTTTYEYDAARYEQFMDKHREFLLILEDRQNFVENVLYPYHKLKEQGIATKKDEAAYKLDYINHLERQKGYWAKIKEYKKEDVIDIMPFATNYSQGFETDWLGARGADLNLKWINRELDYLNKGWAPEDMGFISDIEKFYGEVLRNDSEAERVQKSLQKFEADLAECNKALEDANNRLSAAETDEEKEAVNREIDNLKRLIRGTERNIAGNKKSLDSFKDRIKNDVWTVKDKDDLRQAYNKLKSTYLTSRGEKLKIVSAFKPLIQKNNKLQAKAKDQITNMYFSSDEQVVKFNTDVIDVTYEERERKRIIISLLNIKKKLSTGHRVGTHKDSEDMRIFKENIDKVVEKLSDRSYSIYAEAAADEPDFAGLLNDLAANAVGYQNAKRVEAGYDIEDTSWEGPSSKMGKTRYNAASELITFAKETIKSVRGHMGYIRNAKPVAEAGFKVVFQEDKDYALNMGRDYEVGVANVMNYFSKEPYLIAEHCGEKNNTFTPDNFISQCKPYDISTVSNDDFAVVAFAAIYNCDVIPNDMDKKYPVKDISDPSKAVPHEDIARLKRPMYINDYFSKTPRADIGISFNDYALVPARQKAYELLKSGNKKDMAHVLATAMKEINDECNLFQHIYGAGSTDFACSTEMLKKIMDYAKKDPEIYEHVSDELGDSLEDIGDTLRLKELRDKALDSKLKLKNAAASKKPLSIEEKKECVKNIVRMEFVEKVRMSEINKMVDSNPEFKDFMDVKQMQLYVDIGLGRSSLTDEDISAYKDKLQRNAVKPVYKITKALRNQKGLDELDNKVEPVIDRIDYKKPEGNLLKIVETIASDLNEPDARKNSVSSEKQTEVSKGNQKDNKKSTGKGMKA